MAEILSGGLTWGSIQQAIVTMDKEGHPLTCCNPVTGECLGGGGSSDFSTAEVTVVFDNIALVQLNGVFVDSEGESLVSKGVFLVSRPTNTIVLYKGEQRIPFDGYSLVDYEGEVEVVNDNLKITGNCKLTFDAEEHT